MSEIRFEQAIIISNRVDQQKLADQKQSIEKQQEAIEDFLSGNCDLYSSADWHYFAEVTGKPISWLRENASYSSQDGEYGQMLTNALLDHDDDLIEEFFM